MSRIVHVETKDGITPGGTGSGREYRSPRPTFFTALLAACSIRACISSSSVSRISSSFMTRW